MCLWLFLYQKKFADVLNGILQKNVSEYKHTANAELQKYRIICKYTLNNIQKS